MQSRALLLFFSLGLLAACDAPRETAPGSNEPVDVSPQIGDGALSKRVETGAIVWPSSEPDAVRQTLPTSARDAITRVELPVMLPKQALPLAKAHLVGKPNFYALSTRDADDASGISVVVSATRVVNRDEATRREVQDATNGIVSVRGNRALATQNEGIWSVTWIERGVSYLVEVECARPSEDARCASADKAIEIASDLVFAGGRHPTRGAL